MKILLILLCLVSVVFSLNKPNWALEVVTWDMIKAHPGVLYDYRLGVIGGTYPYHFEFVVAPSGMVIDTVKGIILWDTPSTPSTTNTVDVKITDQNGNTLRHSWNVAVTATGFYFVDSLNGNDANSGTISAPFETFDKAYTSRNRGDIIYLRKGTYHTDSGSIFESTHYPKMIYLNSTKPQTLIGYPGDTVTFDGQFTGTVPEGIVNWEFFIDDSSSSSRMIFQNLNFKNIGYHAFILGLCNKLIIRDCYFGALTTSGAENPSYIHSRSTGEDISNLPRKRIIIQENEMVGLQTGGAGAAVVFFDAERLLFEDNYIHDIGGNGINDKQKGYFNTFRNNRIDSTGVAIVLMAQGGTESIDIGYNLLTNSSEMSLFVGYQLGPMKNIFINHNTFMNTLEFRHNLYSDPASENYNFYNNIIKTVDQAIIIENNATFDSAKVKLSADSNLYYCFLESDQSVAFVASTPYPRYTLSQWQAFGFDPNSQFKDPGLVDYAVPQDSSFFGVIGRDFSPSSGWSGELDPVITVQPQNVTVATVGDTVLFYLAMSDETGLTYEWYLRDDEHAFYNNNDTLKVASAYADTNAVIWCEIHDEGSLLLVSDTVRYHIGALQVSIVTQPANDTVLHGDSALFFVIAENATSYQWFMDTRTNPAVGYTDDTMAFIATSEFNGHYFFCRINDTVWSDSGRLTITPAVLINSVGVKTVVLKRIYKTIDSGYVDGAKGTVVDQNVSAGTLEFTLPLVIYPSNTKHPVVLYYAGGTYSFSLKFMKSSVFNSILNIGVGF